MFSMKQQAIDMIGTMREIDASRVVTFIEDIEKRYIKDDEARAERWTVEDILKEMPGQFAPDPDKFEAFRRLHSKIQPVDADGYDYDELRYEALIDKYGPVSRY